MRCSTCKRTINWVSLREIEYYNDGYAYTPCPDCETLIKCEDFPRRNNMVKEDNETNVG